MNKYEKVLKNMGKILGFAACMSTIIMLITITILPLCFKDSRDSFGIYAALLIELVLFVSVHGTSYFIGLWFLNDRYSASHVSNGNTVWWPKTTYGYVKRNMITNLIETIVSLVFAAFYIILICIRFYYLFVGLMGLILSLIAATVFYLFYKKQQYKLKTEYINN